MREKPLNSLKSTEPAVRHATYYKEGVIIQVENTLFKVPHCMFEFNSPELADILSLPSGGREVGLTDDAPVYLDKISAEDFERLLVIIYPIITSDEYPCATWKAEEWTSVLHLATRWDMKSIRSMAIKNLSSVASPASKVVLGRKYDLPMWIQEGLLTLCLQAEPLKVEEAQILELQDVVGCAAARETIRAKVIEMATGTTMFSSPRLGNIRVRTGKYEDGMKYMNNPAVRDIVEHTFGIVTAVPDAA